MIGKYVSLARNGDLGSWPADRHKNVILMLVNGRKCERNVNNEGENDSSELVATC
jgi:hypothetical protein